MSEQSPAQLDEHHRQFKNDLQKQIQHLTVPALKAQVMANLTKMVVADTRESGFASGEAKAKQTATNKKEQQLSPPGDDVEKERPKQEPPLLNNSKQNKQLQHHSLLGNI